jgi:hypothetical protein
MIVKLMQPEIYILKYKCLKEQKIEVRETSNMIVCKRKQARQRNDTAELQVSKT